MWCSRHRAASALLLCFTAVAITFTLATGVAQVASGRIRSAAHEITSDSSSTISRLSSMRVSLRRLQIRAADYVDVCRQDGCGPLPEDLERMLHRLESDWYGYKDLPAAPNEKEAWAVIDRELGTVGHHMRLVLEAAQHENAEQAWREFDAIEPLFDHIDERLAGIIALDHARAVELAARIDSLARRSMVLSVVLVLASIAFTVAAAALAIRLVRREEELLRVRAEELDEFAGRVAHDVLTPLWSIDAALHVAERGADAQGRAAVQRIRVAVEYIQQLVRDLLEFARSNVHAGVPGASADVRSVVRDVVEQLRPLAQDQAVEVEVEVAQGATRRVACGEGVLSSILANLVGNSIKHMGHGEPRRVVIRSMPSDRGMVRIEVQDTGPGVDASVRGRLFEPFVRGGTSGSAGFGLGLATVKRLVLAHGGHVGYACAPGQGTLFHVELPGAGDPVAAAEPEPPRTELEPARAAAGHVDPSM